MDLVIVESPSKAKTIEKYLGRGYKVMASKGHVVDLPKSNIGIDVDNDFKPDYEIKNPQILQAIKKELANSSGLILAVDPDREGEAIGWHLARELKLIDNNGKSKKGAKHKVTRIVFTEITKNAINEAVNNPRDIDIDLVNAQQTRRILDRLVGYKLSPLLWKKLMFGLSAGRVQSVALKLVVEREEERDSFKPLEYWNIFSFLTKSKARKPIKLVINKNEDDPISEEDFPSSYFKFTLVRVDGKKQKFNKEEPVRLALDKMYKGKWFVSDISSKVVNRSPSPPFNTSTMQQSSAAQLGYNANKTMKLAQQLYERGFITYMRTDSFNISQSARATISKFIEKSYGKEYLPLVPRVYKVKSKVAQEAHEAIRPTHMVIDLSKLSNEQKRLYDLIFKRAVASQMADAKVKLNNICVKVEGYDFEMEGQKVIFPGFYIVRSLKIKEFDLPDLTTGEELFLNILEAEQKFTEPPARYTEATLIKALEANGIGRPSTYAPILTTIQVRKYIEKEGKFIKPTMTGVSLNRLLTDHFPDVVNINFTAQMENDLDDVANGEKDWIKTLRDFYINFNKDIIKGEKDIDKDKYNIVGESDEKCPECGSKMVIKLGRFSPFLSCSKFPKCKGILSLQQNNRVEVDINSDDFRSKYEPGPKTEDGRIYNLKQSRFGYFWAHPDYPKVKDARPLELLAEVKLKVYGKAPRQEGKIFILRKGRFGYFWAHPDYPKVKKIVKINSKEANIKRKELQLL